MAQHKDSNATTDEREAILEEGRAQGRAEVSGPTPRPAESSEAILRAARRDARGIASIEVRDHADHCRDEGPLCQVAQKVDEVKDLLMIRRGAEKTLMFLTPIVVLIMLTTFGWFATYKFNQLRDELAKRAHVEISADAPIHYATGESKP